MEEKSARNSQLRDAYAPSRRMRLASDLASLCAALLLVGLVGTAFTWWGPSPFFDLAANGRQTVKIGPGFLIGPALILAVLPLVLGRPRQLALKRFFRARLAIAAALWLAGLWALLARLATLDSSYTTETGAYVSAGLLLVGFVSTLAMWPGNPPVVAVNRKGVVFDATAAAGPRGCSRRGR